MSCFDGNYRAWGKIVANNNVAVAMVDFRNSVSASSVPEVEPYPAGLNDCVSGLKWVAANAAELKIDPARVVIAGESGGGNLTLAAGMKLLRDGDIGLVTGLYALCPYIAGEWPQERFPSTIQNNGIFLDLHHNRGKHGYGIEAFDAGDPLAWPSFATVDDVRGLPRVVIHVNECDPLRDEGLEFYRLCLQAGVPARARMVPVNCSTAALAVATGILDRMYAKAAKVGIENKGLAYNWAPGRFCPAAKISADTVRCSGTNASSTLTS